MGLSSSFQHNTVHQSTKGYSIGPVGVHTCKIVKLRIYNKGEKSFTKTVEEQFVRLSMVIVGDSPHFGREISWRISVGAQNQFVRDRAMSILSQLESQLDLTDEPLRRYVIDQFGEEQDLPEGSHDLSAFFAYSPASLKKALFRNLSIKITERTSKDGRVSADISDFVVIKEGDVLPTTMSMHEAQPTSSGSRAEHRVAESFSGVPHPPAVAPAQSSQPFNDDIPW